MSDGTTINHTLVRDGWWYRKYAPRDVMLEVLEMRARAAGIGLWVDPRATVGVTETAQVILLAPIQRG
jgi:endonuclease YncB( thermonuclease family)